VILPLGRSGASPFAESDHHPQITVYMARQRERGKTQREAIRCLTRHLIRRIYNLPRDPQHTPTTLCLT
jgi:transposase